MMLLDKMIWSPHSVECSYKDSWQQLTKKSDTGRSYWDFLSWPIRTQVLVMWANKSTVFNFRGDLGNKKTGYLLDICLCDIAKLSSSGQVVMKLNLNWDKHYNHFETSSTQPSHPPRASIFDPFLHYLENITH